jgi:hypothetical protein
MSMLIDLNLANSPFHSVLPNSKIYDFRKISFLWDYEQSINGCIEIEMSTHHDYVTLRFIGIQDLCIPVDILSGVCINILDTSEYITVMPAPIRVQHPKGGGVSFWADDVVLVDRVLAKDSEE